MKSTIPAVLVLFLVLSVLGCDAPADDVAAAEETAEPAAAAPGNGITVENAFYFTHVDGHKKEQEFPAFVMFEYEQLETVKYQVGYVACTCRGPEVNYWSVAFVEINKADNTIATISYDQDNTDHYVAGLYGDSEDSWDGTPVKELFYDQFIPDNILGASEEEIDSYEPMHGEVDAYTGATVTPNNAMRMLQGLFEYHNANYS